MRKNIKNKKACPKSLKHSFLRRGFLMIEVLIAISIISFFVLAAMTVAQKSIQLSGRSLHTSQATFLLEEGAEAVRIIRDNGWNTLSTKTPDTNYCLTFSSNTWNITNENPCTAIGKFTRTVKFMNVNRNASTGDITVSGTNDTGTRLVIVSVVWAEGGQEVVKTLSFYIMDIF